MYARKCFAIGVLLLLASCGRVPTALERQEDALDISNETERQFHTTLYFPKGEALHYPGYIIAFEKSPKAIIDQPPSERIVDSRAAYLGTETNNGHDRDTKELIEGFQKRDRKSLFVSHIIKYQGPTNNDNGRFIDQCFIYNAFESDMSPPGAKPSQVSVDFHGMVWHHCPRLALGPDNTLTRSKLDPNTKKEIVKEVEGNPATRKQIDLTQAQYQAPRPVHDLYGGGLDAMKKLECGLSSHIHQDGYTHLLVLVMGWNTSQDEAIRNFNDIIGNIIEARNEDVDPVTKKVAPFRPLVLGVTWPSYWSNSFTNLFSYANKADDADELGLSWLNVIVNRTIPVVLSQANVRPNVILIGHSFGARAAMRALFSSPLLLPTPPVTDRPVSEVNLLVGLQGAVSINRFIPQRSHEGAPYRDFGKLMNTQVALTASRGDSATAFPLWYKPSGSYRTWESICKSDSNDLKTIFDCRRTDSKRKSVAVPEVSSPSTPATWIPPHLFQVCEDSDASEACNLKSSSENRKILYIDASDTVTMFNSPGSGGGAHSDIYRLPMGQLLWKLIKTYASGTRTSETHAEIEYNKTMKECEKADLRTSSR
ncbi:hypothetical protein SAMN04487926_1082 [Paraburkholderia steynii]|uniref:AB hydrolase-1 domain-containing protein n=1 Tax=Paraburkholderia steynii TaxID=1245441 RepID=A0A7Z7B5V5_9BURK|nr:alpha/beta hydrolase [Paraburkholderia steynii]SDH78034.1 hypothetical protein SAMN04487926_1082 [Paraburkholderia steynii]